MCRRALSGSRWLARGAIGCACGGRAAPHQALKPSASRPWLVGAVVAVDKRRDEAAHLQCGVLARLGDHTRPHHPNGRQQSRVGRRAYGALDHLQR